MAIVDRALRERASTARPVQVGMVGAGFAGKAIAFHIATATPGMRLSVIASPRVEPALHAYAAAGQGVARHVRTVQELQDAIDQNLAAVCEDWRLVCAARGIEAVVEVTGTIDYAAHVVSTAIAHRKHVVLMNNALDGTVGPVLKRRADAVGVIYTNVEGDLPGAIMKLVCSVRSMGLRAIACGVVTAPPGSQNDPSTQPHVGAGRSPASKHVPGRLDPTKMSFDQAVLANATGMGVSRRGMLGLTIPSGMPIEQLGELLQAERFADGPGIVDYVVSTSPAPGGFVVATTQDHHQRRYLAHYRLGTGPLYCFYAPFQPSHFAVPTTIARAVLFHDASIAPAGAATVEVVATAKTNLKAGVVLDDIGHAMTFGQCENAGIVRACKLLPIGIAAGCRLRRNVPRNQVLRYDDVELPAARLIDRLHADQDAMIASQP